jgi:hypothetical protein
MFLFVFFCIFFVENRAMNRKNMHFRDKFGAVFGLLCEVLFFVGFCVFWRDKLLNYLMHFLMCLFGRILRELFYFRENFVREFCGSCFIDVFFDVFVWGEFLGVVLLMYLFVKKMKYCFS